MRLNFLDMKILDQIIKKTIEITKESHLTPRGDCIVGVNASSSCIDLPDELKNKLRNPETKIQFFNYCR